MEFISLPMDILHYITSYLELNSVYILLQTCSHINNIHNWSTYFYNNVDEYLHLYYINNHNIDANFIKNHGRYLLHINDIRCIEQYFIYYMNINYNVLTRFEEDLKFNPALDILLDDWVVAELRHDCGILIRYNEDESFLNENQTDLYTALQYIHVHVRHVLLQKRFLQVKILYYEGAVNGDCHCILKLKF